MIQKIKSCINSWWETPKEYVDFLLIKELYHCTPSELDEQDTYKINLDFQILMLERKKQFIDSKRAEQKSTPK